VFNRIDKEMKPLTYERAIEQLNQRN